MQNKYNLLNQMERYRYSKIWLQLIPSIAIKQMKMKYRRELFFDNDQGMISYCKY